VGQNKRKLKRNENNKKCKQKQRWHFTFFSARQKFVIYLARRKKHIFACRIALKLAKSQLCGKKYKSKERAGK